MSPNPSYPSHVPQLSNTPDHLARFFTEYLHAVPEELSKRGCLRVFLLASSSLASKSDRISKLEEVLGDKVVGKKSGMGAHTPFPDVLNLVLQLHETKADSIVCIGGGSYIDGAKIAMIAHSSLKPSELNVSAIQSLAGRPGDANWAALMQTVKPPTLDLFVVPTTLSAAEYHIAAGGINTETHHKVTFIHKGCRPQCIILDPELCTLTPQRLWLGTGMRAVDHCIESLCSDHSRGEAEKAAEEGLHHLIPGLLACYADQGNVKAHGECQIGAWKAMEMFPHNVPVGASHGIGHQLGSVGGVAHGETTCILLPSVLKYNSSINQTRQEKVAGILWDVAHETFEKQGLSRDRADAGDLIRALVKVLELPSTLREVGVVDEERLDKIAEYSLADWCTKTNPRKLTSKEQVREILQMSI